MSQGLCHTSEVLRGRACWQARIDAWNQLEGCELPIYEPGLEEVVQAARGRNLFFSSDTHKHVAEGDVIFVRCCPPPCNSGIRDKLSSSLATCTSAWRRATTSLSVRVQGILTPVPARRPGCRLPLVALFASATRGRRWWAVGLGRAVFSSPSEGAFCA